MLFNDPRMIADEAVKEVVTLPQSDIYTKCSEPSMLNNFL